MIFLGYVLVELFDRLCENVWCNCVTLGYSSSSVHSEQNQNHINQYLWENYNIYGWGTANGLWLGCTQYIYYVLVWRVVETRMKKEFEWVEYIVGGNGNKIIWTCLGSFLVCPAWPRMRTACTNPYTHKYIVHTWLKTNRSRADKKKLTRLPWRRRNSWWCLWVERFEISR